MRRQFLCILALVCVFALACPAKVQAADWSINSFQTHLTLQSNGVVAVKEVLKVDFGRSEKHGIYRDIPFLYQQKTDTHYTQVKIDTVMRDGKDEPYQQSKSDTYLRLKIGAKHATISGSHTYTITYTVAGVIRRFNTYDELYWNATGNNWDVPLTQATAAISLPQEGIIQLACYQGYSGSTKPCSSEKISATQASFSTNELSQSGEGMTIAVGFTKGMVPILAPQKPKQPIEILIAEFSKPPYWLLTIGAIFIGIAGPLWWWWRHGRDWWWPTPARLKSNQTAWLKPLSRKPQVVVEFEPPDQLRPAQIGVLLDQRADTIDITSTIIDLASRGHLTVKELPKTWIFGSNDYQLQATDKPKTALLPYEKKLLSRLFNRRSQVNLSSLKNTFYKDLAEIKDDVYHDLMQRKYFIDNPKKVRNLHLAVGFGLLIIAAGIAFMGYKLVWAWLLVVAASFGVAGLMLSILSAAMPQRTALGFELYRRALGYKLFISTAEKYRQRFFESQNTFTQALPYAMLFGLTNKFAQALKQIGYQPDSPTWYTGVHAFSLSQFSTDLNSVSKALSSSIASAPSGSGSGGGGSSGGGFGGGGGGSW